MKRILRMVLKNFLFVVGAWLKLVYMARHLDKFSEEERFALLKEICLKANKSGKITIEEHGLENIPEESGYIMYPNHQGMYDVLALISVNKQAFSVVAKKEVEKMPFLKNVLICMKAFLIDRENLKQSMEVIVNVAKEVEKGRNYVIFAEGTRSKSENKILEFKGGAFKSAMKAKCPIVPVALINSYKPFDTDSREAVKVPVYFLKPISYEEYKDKKTTEIAKTVHDRIEKVIEEWERENYGCK